MPSLAFKPVHTANERVERDNLGELSLPASALYGIHTQRALDNFGPMSKPLGEFPALVTALATIKLAYIQANASLKLIPATTVPALTQAAQEIIDGQWHESFPISLLQGGAGTSSNMNMNEVITNRALALSNFALGSYHIIHPNDHVNVGQSTNDVYPSAIRLALIAQMKTLLESAALLSTSLKNKASEFTGVAKLGRTQLQDAVPMLLSDEILAFATGIDISKARCASATEHLYTLNLGGTAIGTGITADKEFARATLENLRALTNLPLQQSSNLIHASWDAGDFVDLSSSLKRLAICLGKIASDLRLLGAGPNGGLAELTLPKRAAGSSIMPGKVNPIIPELVNQVVFDVLGRDHSICIAAEQGQLQLNAFEPLMAENLFTMIERLSLAMNKLRVNCIDGLQAHAENCQRALSAGSAMAAVFNGALGYDTTSKLVQQAQAQKLDFLSLLRQEGILSTDEIAEQLAQAGLQGFY